MDSRAHEREGQALHGLVIARIAIAAGVATALATGIAGGLARLGVVAPFARDAAWLGHALLAHAALMICGFLGAVIGVERAVAVKLRLAWGAPLASLLGASLLLMGRPGAAVIAFAAASGMFVLVNVVVVRRQTAAHTVLLLAGACAWLAGNGLLAAGAAHDAVLAWWFAFLVMTIAAERLEMTRLMRRHAGASGSLFALLATLLAGAGVAAFSPAVGGLVYGCALAGLAVWLGLFDVARRTVKAQGLPRYMAVCLLGGYAWLAVAGIAWAAMAWGLPARDAALHALGLGFIVSMMMGHAPVILPAVTRVKVVFTRLFYLPLALLYASLLLRLAAGHGDFALRAAGAAMNAAAIVLFAFTLAGAALAWRVKHGGRRRHG